MKMGGLWKVPSLLSSPFQLKVKFNKFNSEVCQVREWFIMTVTFNAHYGQSNPHALLSRRNGDAQFFSTDKNRMLFFFSAFDFPATDQPLWITPFKSCCWRREKDFSSSQKLASYLFIFKTHSNERRIWRRIPVPLPHEDCLKGRKIKRKIRGSRGGAARRWTNSRIETRKDEAAT